MYLVFLFLKIRYQSLHFSEPEMQINFLFFPDKKFFKQSLISYKNIIKRIKSKSPIKLERQANLLVFICDQIYVW